jgi:RimJ/RimL family protein N-acetyltransferase
MQIDIPLKLETERLILRCPHAGDGEMVYASIAESLADLRQFPASQPWVMAEQSAGASEIRCLEAEKAYLARVAFPMVILLKPAGGHAGNVGLHTIDWSVPKCEVGFWCRSSLKGNGYITEALIAITSFAFTHLDMRRVEACTDELNVGSWRVCERARYSFVKTRQENNVNADAANSTERRIRIYAANR